MRPDEVFITVKPSTMRDVVKHALELAGYEITGSGGMVASPDATGDIWAVPPKGTHPSEYGPDMTVLEDFTPSNESPGTEQ